MDNAFDFVWKDWWFESLCHNLFGHITIIIIYLVNIFLSLYGSLLQIALELLL